MRGILVGLGGRSRSWYEVCRRNPSVELVGYVEISPERRQQAQERWGLDDSVLFESLEEAIRATEADFVVDVTPPAVHERVALTALEHGLHVLGEKPLSDDFEAAKRMVRAAQESGRVHMITQNYRFGAVPPNDPPASKRGDHRPAGGGHDRILSRLGPLAGNPLRDDALSSDHRYGDSPFRPDAVRLRPGADCR
ncbi:MAG: hypothetical protein KatS3mg115_0382 [Candidatus Poribacteria bacterium]|nr:MAG: hypothetical protein KatS3mg115_0382 [Candidatus Poribacteria bacterium]